MKLTKAIALVFIVCLAGPAFTEEVPSASSEIKQQEAQPAIREPAPPPEMPTVTQDNNLFKRTPAINGLIEKGEWDTLYTFNYGDLRATVYADWDNENIYIASKTTSPTDLLVILDANNDGWFHGLDNYEFVVRRSESGGTPTLSVSRYESQKTAKNNGSPLAAAEAASFTLKASSDSEGYIYELAIPKSAVNGLDLKNGNTIGLKVAVGVGDEDMIWIPTAPLGETQSAQLVTAKSSVALPVSFNVKARDPRLAPGEELVAKITIKNNGTALIPADTLIVGGEGKTAKSLGSQLIRMDGIEPGKSFTTTFKSPVSRSAATGSAAMGIELRSSDECIASTMLSFDIVPAYEITLDRTSEPLKPGVYNRIYVIVKNNTQREMHGRVKLSLPDGWTFRWSKNSQDFYISQEDGEQAVVFRVRPPAKPQERTPILAELHVGDEVISTSSVITVK